ncbi:hypothetical protein [Candidatus Rariloculus sp.]|uniref:hypothetical protein n=1 Tax=Candidatus Rariloculus sp. TaxID=3101265 RepID=UPI003D09B2EB
MIGIAAAAVLASGVHAQSQTGNDYVPPRTPDGQPDLQGIWSNAVITPLERPTELADKAFLSEQEVAEYEQRRLAETNMDDRNVDARTDVGRAYNHFWWDRGTNVVATRRTSLIIDPPDGRIPPLTAEGEKRAQARAERRRLNRSDGPEDRPLMERCIHIGSAGPPMLPSAYNNNFHLAQTADHVLIVNEMIHDTRVIPLDGRPQLPGTVRQWLGSSRGHWDGDTLVIETANFGNQTNFRGASENMHLTERFTRIDENILLYEFTVDDPAAFTRPWTVQIPSVRIDGLMYEYACHEGNEGMVGILAGARAEEQAAAEAAR